MNKYKNQFEICARGIIKKQGRILVCKNKEKDYYFFPGGHVEFRETAEVAFTRELKEELNISIKKMSFIGMVENIYKEDNEIHHEINLVFEVPVGEVEDKSRENHIDFFFFNKGKFLKEEVLPRALKTSILKWLKDKIPFWVKSQVVH